MYFTYIIHSKTNDRYYTGHAHDLTLRLERHNTGGSRSTKSGIPWEIVYYEAFNNKADAIKRERQIKSWKSSQKIKTLIDKWVRKGDKRGSGRGRPD